MYTYSHALIQHSLARRWQLGNTKLKGFLIGAILPDILIIIIGITKLGFFSLLQFFQNGSLQISSHHLFSNTFVTSAHNLFHSPLSLTLLLITTLLLPLNSRPKTLLTWILFGSFFHSATDILTHHNDGPLLLWPLNSTLRFHSPISYWNPAHLGIPFTIFEHTLDTLLFLKLAARKLKSSITARFIPIRNYR